MKHKYISGSENIFHKRIHSEYKGLGISLKKKKSTMVFLVVRYESWIIKKDECQRIYALESCGWRRLLRIPWTAGRSNQSILKEINPEYSLEGLTLKVKLQYFNNLMQRTDSLEKPLMLGKIEGKRRRRRQRLRWLNSIIHS